MDNILYKKIDSLDALIKTLETLEDVLKDPEIKLLVLDRFELQPCTLVSVFEARISSLNLSGSVFRPQYCAPFPLCLRRRREDLGDFQREPQRPLEPDRPATARLRPEV